MSKKSFVARAMLSSTTLVAAVLIPGAAPASADPACGSTITQNTTLTADLNCSQSPGEGIRIGASNITLDLGGHTIIGAGQADLGAGIVIPPFKTGITVQNGTVTRFDAGVAFILASGNTVRRMVIRDNLGAEEFGSLHDGITLLLSSNNVISGNVIDHNGGASGIRATGGSNGNTITGNAITRNNLPFASGDGSVHDVGVGLDSGANGNTVGRNAVVGSGLDGISVADGSNDNTIDSNAVSSNGFSGLMAGGARLGDGIRVSGSNNLVQRNAVVGNAANGIFVDAQPNRFVVNIARGNRATDLRDTNGPSPCGTDTWSANQAGTANPSCTLAP